jgi:hypothetical protein
MASGTTGNFYDDDHAVLDEDFLNDGETAVVNLQGSANSS